MQSNFLWILLFFYALFLEINLWQSGTSPLNFNLNLGKWILALKVIEKGFCHWKSGKMHLCHSQGKWIISLKFCKSGIGILSLNFNVNRKCILIVRKCQWKFETTYCQGKSLKPTYRNSVWINPFIHAWTFWSRSTIVHRWHIRLIKSRLRD